MWPWLRYSIVFSVSVLILFARSACAESTRLVQPQEGPGPHFIESDFHGDSIDPGQWVLSDLLDHVGSF